MLSDKTKLFLRIILNLKPSFHFLMSYIVIWFVWHNEFISSLVMTNGGLYVRLQSALDSVSANQYIVVLFLTIMLTLIIYRFDYLTQILADDDNSEEFTLLQNSNSAKHDNDVNIKKLMVTLESAQLKLSESLEREKQYKQEKIATTSKVIQLQSQLEELMADNIILNEENNKLKASNKVDAVLYQS
ncbi:hypothetical protein Q4530_00500 [Colwellia sp. 1_MG-2023]|uniref:hypothetical protein n=1 Tax=unclassified Colwellia TaxID=196834 RepID=UPI001C089F21|nr:MULTISPECIES: hypothetical protein [unclassified Colwellia]MBU2924352.1 hypothetical protein [Colwellia sp. C2M11]MDO6650846.1 hypothetical protein [Colwellia sp. 3_MG-2023]MDO6663881.1 hypothetical protein [Colwellia sp. 2_MG-2023]MDO6688232.1 hypothetical protein [Colwellia sp. 1_MG-2023]